MAVWEKFAVAIGIGILAGSILAATGFHVRINVHGPNDEAGSAEQIIDAIRQGMSTAHIRETRVAFMDDAQRSGGIVGDKRDGNYGGGNQLGDNRSGGIFQSHGATGSWADSTMSETGRHVTNEWGVDISIGWDRGPEGHIGASFSHGDRSDYTRGGSDRDH